MRCAKWRSTGCATSCRWASSTPTSAATACLSCWPWRACGGRKVGLLTDAASLPLFARKVLAQLRAEAVIAHGDGEIQFIPAAGLAELDDIADEDVLPFSVEQSNSSIRFGERMVLKVLRKILPGCTRKSRSAAT